MAAAARPRPADRGDAEARVSLEASGWALDVDQLEELVTPRTKVIFICNPNNPTGRVEDAATLRRIIAAADRVGAYVLSDEVYRGLEWTDVEPPRVATMYDRGVSTGSVSKLEAQIQVSHFWHIERASAGARFREFRARLVAGDLRVHSFVRYHPHPRWLALGGIAYSRKQ